MKSTLGVVVGLAFALLVAAYLFGHMFYTTVDPDCVGVAQVWGSVNPKPLSPGFHKKSPWTSVHQVRTRLQAFDAQARSQSSDLQVVNIAVTVQYSLNPALVPAVYIGLGDASRIEPTILSPAIQNAIKTVTSQYTAEELVVKRDQVKAAVEEAIKSFINSTLADKHLDGALDIGNVAITSFDFSSDFNAAIEAKVQAQQHAEQAKNDRDRTIINADAARDAKNAKSEAQAYKVLVVAQASAYALQLEGAALRQYPEVTRLRAIEEWDGQFPTFMGGSGSPGMLFNMPFPATPATAPADPAPATGK